MYKCIKNVNTDLGAFKVGDVVGEGIGSKYSQFEKIEEVKEVKPPKKVKAKKVKKVEELLVETPTEVEVTIEEEVIVEDKPKRKWF